MFDSYIIITRPISISNLSRVLLIFNNCAFFILNNPRQEILKLFVLINLPFPHLLPPKFIIFAVFIFLFSFISFLSFLLYSCLFFFLHFSYFFRVFLSFFFIHCFFLFILTYLPSATCVSINVAIIKNLVFLFW